MAPSDLGVVESCSWGAPVAREFLSSDRGRAAPGNSITRQLSLQDRCSALPIIASIGDRGVKLRQALLGIVLRTEEQLNLL